MHWAAYTAAALGIPSLAESIFPKCSSDSEPPKRKSRCKLDNPQPVELTSLGYLFGPDATAALERDILFLLDFNMRFDEEDLRDCLNALSSHERAEGPLGQLRLGQGRPKLSLGESCLSSISSNSTVRSKITSKYKTLEDSRRAPTVHLAALGSQLTISLISPPCTPVCGTLKRDYVMKRNFPPKKDSNPIQNTKPPLEVNINPARSRMNSHFSNTRPYTHYPQLNSNMDVNYFLVIDGFKPKHPFTPIGAPTAPPPTPTAGIESLPFAYGGEFFSPALQPPALDNLIVAPDEDSPWTHGQVGAILRKTMAYQAHQLVSLSEKETRDITVLNTPPPVPAFGSGTLYKENPNRSSVELARVARLTVSDLRWYYALKRQIPLEMLDGELSIGVKEELVRLGIPIPKQDNDGMSLNATQPRGRLVTLSPASPPSSHVHPVLKTILDKRIYRHARGRHYQAFVDSGPADLLNTGWDKKLRAELEAKGLDECEQQFKTTAPLRLVKKDGSTRRMQQLNEHIPQESNRVVRQHEEGIVGQSAVADSKFERDSTSHRYHSVDQAAGTLVLNAGIHFVPAPKAVPTEPPQKVGWFSRLLGGSHGG
ncbi:hypothetical protein OPQ81_009361 [Rhizoctonia solani]|nr:hypothetical protein OPQ81_009361 [Rhizoctonia solani]